MSDHGGAVSELVDQPGRLPGIGRKSAERLAFHLLRVSETEALLQWWNGQRYHSRPGAFGKGYDELADCVKAGGVEFLE